MAYRLLQEFRQALTRLDTPPLSIRHHPGSAIAPASHIQHIQKALMQMNLQLHHVVSDTLLIFTET